MRSIVSIEVCPDAIRAAEILKPLSKNPKISKVGEIVIPAGIANESSIVDPDLMVKVLEQLWESSKFSTRNVSLVVSGRRFITRSYDTVLPSMKTLKPVLKTAASSVIPEGMNNPALDFFPTHHVNTKNNVKTVGLVIATPSEPIEEIIGVLVRAKLNLQYVDFAPMAISRFINNNYSEEERGEAYAIANIREKSTDIVVAKNGIPRMVRVASAGLSNKEENKGARFADEGPTGILSTDGSISSSEIEEIAKQIRLSISSQVEALNVDVPKVYVAGPKGSPALSKELSEILRMDVEILNADNVKRASEFDKELSTANFVAICGGMRGNR